MNISAKSKDVSSKQTILVVDDEKAVRNGIRRVLEQACFSVLEAGSGKEVIASAREFLPALMILDLNLTDVSGMAVCAAVKNDEHVSHIPIIVLTGDSEAGRNVTCLDLGADDYMTKPFDPKELVARVSAVLRRINYAEKKSDLIKRDGILIDLGRRAAVLEGKTVVENFTPKEFDILSLLVQNSPNLLSRDFLAKKVWGRGTPFVNNRTIDVHIRRVRSKLGSCILGRLRTVSGKGYKFL